MSDLPSDELTFEEALAQLEEIVRALEEGNAGLDESLARYENGIALIKRCHAQLQQAEQRILLLTGEDEEGQPVLQPFKHKATSSRKGSSTHRPSSSQDSELPF